MSRTTILLLAAAAVAGPPRAAGADPVPEKLFARCVDAAALVYGPADTKDLAPVAGALVLDRDRRLLLAPSTNVPDAPTALFPAYTAAGELRNKPADYADLWKKGERWAGKVLHRDKDRDLAVIELDRAPPDRARAAEFRAESVGVGAFVYALNQPKPGGDKMWELREGRVRAIGLELHLAPGSYPPKRPAMLTATAPRGNGPDCGLFDRAGRVVGFASPPVGEAAQVNAWLNVTEIRAFLEAKKVPFQSATEERGPKGPKAK